MAYQSRSAPCPYCGKPAELRRHGFDMTLGGNQPPELELICPLKHTGSVRVLAPLWSAAGVKLRQAAAADSDEDPDTT